jgi:proteasome lid subunit RPN8/RPN11
MPKYTSLVIPRDILMTLLHSAKHMYPRETFLILRGKKREPKIFINDLLIPPFATHGIGFASAPFHHLPIDTSILGSAHSHPSGNVNPSPTDMNHFYGAVLLITGYPYEEQNIAVYDREGQKLTLEVTEQNNEPANNTL